jgi:hypothetical protein
MSIKTFLPRTVELSPEVIEKLKKDFKLSNNSIEEIKYWNGPGSPYGGVIIDPEDKQFVCYPYDKGKKSFLEDYFDGEIFEV